MHSNHSEETSHLRFNEYTTHARLEFRELHHIPEMVFRVLSSCKILKRMTLHYCSFSEEWLCNSLSWHSLIELDLLFSSCSDKLIMHAIDSCPNLEILKACGAAITDKCLFYLCDRKQCFKLCESGGECCNLGKNINKLTLYDTNITNLGMICALEHLPALDKFIEGDLIEKTNFPHMLPIAIHMLEWVYESDGLPPRTLQLSLLLHCKDSPFLNGVPLRTYCPFINTEVVNQLRDTRGTGSFLSLQDDEVTFGLHSSVDETISLHVMISCLQNIEDPVTHVFTEGPKHLTFEGESLDGSFDPPDNLKSLKQLHLRHVSCDDEIALDFFTKLLRQAAEVKSLTLPGNIAERCFVNAMETNAFSRLEEISIHHADLKSISLKRLMQRNKCTLKKIAFLKCENTADFVMNHKDIACKNNVVLVHDSERRRLHDSIKFDLI